MRTTQDKKINQGSEKHKERMETEKDRNRDEGKPVGFLFLSLSMPV